MYDDRHKEIVKDAKELAKKLISENKGYSRLEIIRQVLNVYRCNGFGLKEAKDIVDEVQAELLSSIEDIAIEDPEKKVTQIVFSRVRQDMDLYAELVEKIEGLEAQIRLITKKYPYIKFPRYAREPSQSTTQEQKA